MKRALLLFFSLAVAVSPVAAQSTGGDGSAGSDGAAASGSTSGAAGSVGEALDPSLFAVGSLGASNLYFSYVVLGTVADGFASRGYGADMARSLAEEAIALNRGSRNALQSLIDEGRVAEEDQDVVSQMIDAHGLLIQQAEGLLAYIEDRSKTEQFQRYRQEAWDRISAVLGIPESGLESGSSSETGSNGSETGGGSGSSGSGSDRNSGSGR